MLVHRVIARLNVGGPAMHVVNLTRGLDATGRFRTRLLAGRVTADEGDMGYYAREKGVSVTELPSLSRLVSPVGDLRILATLYSLFRRERPAVVHTHTAKAGTLGRLAAWWAGVPVRIHTYHGHVLGGGYFPSWVTRFFLEVERQLARISQRLVVLSERQRREMALDLKVAPWDRFAVIPLGLELEPFARTDREAARVATRGRLGIPEDRPVVGIVGRLVPIKNHGLLLRAVPMLESMHGRRVDLLIVGSGLLEKELRNLAASLDLADRCHWLGWRRDLPALYPAMDVLALTSVDEGTPVAVLEALAAGTPVAARAVGGVPEILADVPLAELIWEATPAAVAKALHGVLRRPHAPGDREMVRRGVCERFSVARLVADMAELYETELAMSKDRGRGHGPFV